MLGKIFIALFWLAFISEIFYAITCCKKYFGSTKIRSHEPDTSTIVCSVSTSILAILVTMFFIFASKDTKEAFRSDPLLGYLAIPINQIALVSFMFIGVFSYYMGKQIKYAKPSTRIETGDLSAFDDYVPTQRTKSSGKTNGFNQLSIFSQTATIDEPKATNPATNDPCHYINSHHANTDNSAATLYIMQLNGEINAQSNFGTLNEAKDYANNLDFGNAVIISDHTLIFSMKGRRTDTEYKEGSAVLYEFLDTFGKATLIERHDRKHYLEIARGLWNDEHDFDHLDNEYYITLFNFD